MITITKPKRYFYGGFCGGSACGKHNQKHLKTNTLIAFMIPSPAPLFKEPAQKAGFCISAAGLFIELRSIIRRQRLTPSGPARQARRSTPPALVRAGHHYLKNPAYGWVFAFLQPDSPSNCVRLFAASGSPLRGRRDRRAVQRLRR